VDYLCTNWPATAAHREMTGGEALIARYAWPGNVRELRNCIESMIVISDDDILDVADLPEYVSADAIGAGAAAEPPGG